MKAGKCRLTGDHGIYLKSHLIPAALTRSEKGVPFIEAGNGLPPKRSWNSWYDKELVIQKGERILTNHDTWAIEFMRKHRLVWSGWGEANVLEPSPLADASVTMVDRERGHEIHFVKAVDSQALRLFFMSLLWRPAATGRPEFAEVSLPFADLERLRRIMVNEEADSFHFYPVVLTQLSTRGPFHNQTPIKTLQQHRFVGGPANLEVFRFYFDGLIAHIYLPTDNPEAIATLGSICLGNGKNELIVTAIEFNKSFQFDNMQKLIAETHALWPEKAVRLLDADGMRSL
ncbi:hypothetical protein [Cupriavidus plantarum]